MSNPGRMQRRWMYLSEVEQYCLNSLTPQRSEMQKSRPRSAANWRIGFDERIGSREHRLHGCGLRGSGKRKRYFTTIDILTSLRALGCLPTWSWQTSPSSCIPKTPQHGCIQSSRLAAAIGMQAITCEMHSQAASGVALAQDRESPLFVV